MAHRATLHEPSDGVERVGILLIRRAALNELMIINDIINNTSSKLYRGDVVDAFQTTLPAE